MQYQVLRHPEGSLLQIFRALPFSIFLIFLIFLFSCNRSMRAGRISSNVEFDVTKYDLLIDELLEQFKIIEDSVYVSSKLIDNSCADGSEVALYLRSKEEHIECKIDFKFIKKNCVRSGNTSLFSYSLKYRTINYSEIRWLSNQSSANSNIVLLRMVKPLHICDNIWYTAMMPTHISGDGAFFHILMKVNSDNIEIIDIQDTGMRGQVSD